MAHNPRKANGHRRRQVESRVYREETHCWLCGAPVDMSIAYRNPHTGAVDPRSRSVDEIIPVSLGGDPIDRSNCRLAHLGCNIRRGNGTRSTRVRPPVEVKRARTY